ncbi:macrolide phosphotransferase k [Pseudozyma hubeiensis SY62]|uniref:MFS-type efflux pump MMF1 n=1 Tax=Pseudozyma hubeiensis (strain SY62) TaxID=1305764 RepID=R9NZI7_PSEHS|nr:macrolide phosphotransferase k [Pseudozyma hubeiensis SY62]GAC94132.1 macrolide phosphotransferase k [Pseudozyma hubeiensis SY62]
MLHPSYEMSSTPQPIEPLSSSPTIEYHPWSSHQEQELRGQSSRSQLIIPTNESVSFHTAYSHDHHQIDYWEQPALQPSRPIFTHMSKREMESPTLSGTDEVHEDVSAVVRNNLQEYGLHDARGKKTLKFWILILAFSITVMLTALDMTMISTALPSIVKDLPMSTIAGGWVTSSYLLTVTAFQPMFGGMSCVIGRRWSLVFAVILFLGGSVICGCANSILLLVVGRGVQGLGGGGIQAIGEITISDITTLRERGFFVGIFGLVFAVASFIAPVLGGYFSDHDWRWIFWINIPIGAVALIMLVPTMNLPVPSMPLKTKIAKMDVVANTVLLGSVVSILIAVTEGGVSHPWSSARIWVPMAIGMVGFFLFLAIEFVPNRLSTHPVLPARLFGNRTACSAFLMTFLHGIATYGAIYALPIYFQSIKDQKPLKSAVSTFPSTAPTAPFAIVAGIIMAVTGKYKDLTFIGWAFTAGGFGWMTRFQTGTSEWELVVAQIVTGVGIGILFAITLPPIQASLPIEELETATATYAFCRSFGAIWGIAITTSVLTAHVSSKLGSLPQAAELGLTGPTVLGYVENIKNLPEPIREQVRQMYADGLQKAMYAFLPIVVVGFACCFFIKDLPLPDFIRGTDDGSTEEQRQQQQEAQIVTTHQVSFHSSPASSYEPYREKHSPGSPHDDTLVGSASDHSHRSQRQLENHSIPSKSSMQQVSSFPDAYATDAYQPRASTPHARQSSEATMGEDGYGGIVAPERAHW